MKTQKPGNDAEGKIIDATEKLKPEVMPPLSGDEVVVVDAFIRLKRVEARAKARAKELTRTVLAILMHRKAIERRGAWVSLKRNYDYHYSEAVTRLEESVKLMQAMEKKMGVAKSDTTLSVAFEDTAAKSLKKAAAALP